MPGIELVKAFLQRAALEGSRSTVINPLGWLILILLGGLSSFLYFKSPPWLVTLVAVFLSIAIGIYLLAFIYFALKSPDSLRSERFTLSKMMIEKSIKGDDLTGLIDPSKQTSELLLPNTPAKPEEVQHEQ